MAKKTTTKKKRNPQDTTLRNLRSIKALIAELRREFEDLQSSVAALEQRLPPIIPSE